MTKANRFAVRLLVATWVIFFVAAISIAFVTRGKLQNKYDQGLKYYESGEYIEALRIFDDLKGWGYHGEGRTMYEKTLDAIEANTQTDICPACGQEIRTYLGK